MPATKTHRIIVSHTDSGSGFDARVSLLEVVVEDPREPTPPREIAWGNVERWGIHVDHHDAPVACTIGVRYLGGLAACLRAWGCKVVRVLATSSDERDHDALVTELAGAVAVS